MKIAILMSTYNGEKYLNEQLESIFMQKVNAEITVYIRDDGSKDNTIRIIKNWTAKLNIVLFEEDNIGPANSFWKLFTFKKIEADYYAFCDQDDIWDSNKLQIGMEALNGLNEEALWCSNCRIVDQNGAILFDKMYEYIPDFSIVSQFVCGTTQGCAMLVNHQLRKHILQNDIEIIPMHDFVIMTYAIARGKILYEENPTFSYRVHNNNVVAKEGKNFIQHIHESLNKWFSKEHKNELTQYAEMFVRDNECYLDTATLKYLNDLIESKNNIVYRFKIVCNVRTKAKNVKAERAFKIKTLLGII